MALLRGTGQPRLGLLVTADSNCRPHATYMGSLASPSFDRLLTMTSPDSRKVRNILENSQVEWLFLDEERDEVLYLWGTARVIQDPREVERAWRDMPDKTRAYFLPYQETVGMRFLMFETSIDVFEYRIPRTNESFRFQKWEVEKLVA